MYFILFKVEDDRDDGDDGDEGDSTLVVCSEVDISDRSMVCTILNTFWDWTKT